MYADVEAVLLEHEPPCTARLFDFRTGLWHFVEVVPKEMWLDFHLKTFGLEVLLPAGDKPYVKDDNHKGG